MELNRHTSSGFFFQAPGVATSSTRCPLHRPLLSRKVGNPLSALIPAPVSTNTLSSAPMSIFALIASNVTEQHHKTEVQMALLVTMKQRQPRIGCDKVHFSSASSLHHEDVLCQATQSSPLQSGDFKTVPVKMYRMIVHALVFHHQTISLAFPEGD